MKFPEVGLVNNFYIGDNVLLEPMADALADQLGKDVYVVSRYCELFHHHPRVVGLPMEGPFPPDMRYIDMADAIRSMRASKVRGKDVIEFIPGKYDRLWEAAGLEKIEGKSPVLYLSDAEKQQAAELRRLFGEKCVGMVLHSNMPVKIWPYMKQLMKRLSSRGYDVFAIAEALRKHDSYVLDYGAYRVIAKPLRELMTYLSIMDVVMGSDTGPVHIAAALGVPTVVITRKFWEDLWPYDKCTVITTKHMTRRGLYAIGPKKVYAAVVDQLGHEPVKKRRVRTSVEETVALFRLDGLGGSITLADHAKKIYELTGKKSTVIVRGYGVAFRDNPHVRDVVEVGYVKWHDCLQEMKERYSTLAEIRFAPAMWHQSDGKMFEEGFGPTQELFDAFPDGYRGLEVHGLHHVQLTDKYLGLPHDSIDMEIFYFEEADLGLPEDYVLITNGVDIQHGSMRQTKTWDGWAELVDICPLPAVQAGMPKDPYVKGAIDVRGKTNVAQFFSLVRQARAVICSEGGTMHAAYAVKAKNAIILRGPTRGVLFEYPGHRFVDSYICDICWSSTPAWYEKCPKGIDSACMESITPARVLYNLQEALGENLA